MLGTTIDQYDLVDDSVGEDKFTRTDLKIKEQELESLRIKNEVERQDMSQRREYAERIFSMASRSSEESASRCTIYFPFA